jgi:glycosyltransferase involved in cell wall biosynthesis
VRVVQIGDVASVAPALADALRNDADVISLPLRQSGARRGRLVKLFYGPSRVIDAARAARRARSLKPDVVHVHWVPNGIVGLMLGCPWILHVHGSDFRNLDRLRRHPYSFLLRAATEVVYATPDLARWVLPVRPDAELLPPAIPIRPGRSERDWDVLVASRAALSKGSDISAATVTRLLGEDPGLRIAAVDGPDFASPAVRLGFGPKEAFVERLARSRVVVGQFRVPALGISELEAMSVGRPVVTNIDLGLYPDPPPVVVARDAEAAATAIRRLLDTPAEADALGLAGERWVRDHHSPAAVASAALAVYRQALAARDGRRP